MMFYAHQKKIIDEDPNKAGLFLGTGSGKTRTALALARGKTLVICPKTQKEDGNWERELESMGGHILPVFEQSGDKVYYGGFGHNTLTTISKETFRRDWEKLEAFDTVIVDEAHTCLGVTANTRQRARKIIPKTSQLYEALEGFLAKHPPRRFYLCTATIMRSPMTVWAAKQLLQGPHLDMMSDFYAFRHKFYTRLPMPGREVWAPRSSNDVKDELAALVRSLGYVGRLEDFFDVPEQTFRTDYLTLTERQRDRIKSLKTEFPEAIVRVGKKHQVENGVLAGDEFNAPEFFDNTKIEKILDYAIEFPRMVIFVKYRAQIDQIQAALTKAKIFTWTLTGDTVDRGAVIKQANELDGVLIAQAQISAGWEVPNTPVMIFASRTYSFVDYDQALGRIQRANHIKKNLYISLVVKGGVDEAVHDSLLNKSDFNERIYATTT